MIFEAGVSRIHEKEERAMTEGTEQKKAPGADIIERLLTKGKQNGRACG